VGPRERWTSSRASKERGYALLHPHNMDARDVSAADLSERSVPSVGSNGTRPGRVSQSRSRISCDCSTGFGEPGTTADREREDNSTGQRRASDHPVRSPHQLRGARGRGRLPPGSRTAWVAVRSLRACARAGRATVPGVAVRLSQDVGLSGSGRSPVETGRGSSLPAESGGHDRRCTIVPASRIRIDKRKSARLLREPC